MSLRARLWLVVGALALVPLVISGVLGVYLFGRAQQSNAADGLHSRAAAASQLVRDRCNQAQLAARSLAAEAVSASGASATAQVMQAAGVDYAALLDEDGAVLAEAGKRPGDPEALRSCASSGGSPVGYLAARVFLRAPTADGARSAVVATAVGGAFLRQITDAFTQPEDDHYNVAAFGADDRLLAVAQREPTVGGGLRPADDTDGDGELRSGGVGGWVEPPVPGQPFTLLVFRESPTSTVLQLSLVAAVLLVALVALVFGWRVAQRLTDPLDSLTDAAEAVAAGDLEHSLPVRSHDEIGRLSAAFNEMTRELRATIRALEGSRDELRHSLTRLGVALGSTLDLPGLLQVVLESAITVTGASGGAAWAADGSGPLILVAHAGEDRERPQRISPFASERGAAQDLFARAAGAPGVHHGEDSVVVALRRGRVVGLLQLDVPAGRPLAADSDDTLQALASQASIAVDNVLLHQEAQQLSNTDPLTGLGNFRYLSSNLAREIERAHRFDRPLAVLMLDLDHFKAVNDTYGHARGDAVLRELAARVSEQVREVDTVARYGGEEFVLVLPETGMDGATRLAERICVAVRRQPFRDESDEGQPPVPVTVSIGVAAFPQHGGSAATLMRTADAALYAAKTGGRDQWRAAEG